MENVDLKVKPRYSADRPNAPPLEDLLGRDAFAQRLAQDISAWTGADSLVIGIYGNWGSGKTSLKQRVIWHLQREDPNCPILDFNPWQFSGDGDLSGAFLRELDAVLRSGKSGRSSSNASKLLQVYIGRLSGFTGTAAKTFAPLAGERSPFWAAAVRAFGEILTRFGNWLDRRAQAKEQNAEKTLPEIKQALATAMSQLDHPILVSIDDIDRLQADEIPEIFQLVKINADFPKLIYLLLFDREVISDALNKVSGGRGKDYLEKIVQVAYHLPEAPIEKIREILFKGIDGSLEGRGAMDRWEQDRWSTLFLDGMSVYFLNLRHVYRFLGSFDFQVRHFQRSGGFEVNPVDLLALETVRVFEPKLYEQLFRKKPLLTGDYGLQLFDDRKQEEINSELTGLLLLAADATRAAARHIIQTVFPPATSGRRDQPTDQWLRQARVCHSEIFDKYFTLQLRPADLGQVELERLIGLATDRDKFRAALKELEGRGVIKTAMARFDAYKDQVPLESIPALITALCDCADSFPEHTLNVFEFDPLTHAWRIVYFGLLREATEEKRFEILDQAIRQTTGLALPVRIVSREERSKEPDAESHEYLINEDHVERLKKICVDKLRTAAECGTLKSITHGAMLLWRWSEWDSLDRVRGWLKSECEKNGTTPWLLSVLTSEGSTNGKPFHYLNWGTLTRFADPNLIEQQVKLLVESRLADREKIGLQQFRRALKRKQAGKADLTGREWRDDE